MLPSRSRLTGWNTSTLTTGATKAAADSGNANGGGLEGLANDTAGACLTLSENGSWSGSAHDAANATFARMKRAGDAIADYGNGVASAMNTTFHAISRARNDALDKATEIDQDRTYPPLYVFDNWVVLIKNVKMTRDEYVSAKSRQETRQVEMNEKVIAVKNADRPDTILSAAASFGFTMPSIDPVIELTTPPVLWGGEPPNDNVPDPSNIQGIQQQWKIRAEDAAVTVTDRSVTKGPHGEDVTTLTMQDGSKQVIATYTDRPTHFPEDTRLPSSAAGSGAHTSSGSTVSIYDPNGNLVSAVSTLRYDNGDNAVKAYDPKGQRTVTFWTDSRGNNHGDTFWVDKNGNPQYETLTKEKTNAFFSHPVLTTVGGGITALQTQAERGLPPILKIDPDVVNRVGIGAKYAGPALGIATTIYDVAAAPNAGEACTAAISGSLGTGAGIAAAAALSETGPIGAGLGSMGATWVFGGLGNMLGEAICK